MLIKISIFFKNSFILPGQKELLEFDVKKWKKRPKTQTKLKRL